MEQGEVRFHKDEQGLQYIGLTSLSKQAGTMLIQTVWGNFEGFTKKEVLQAKEARRGQYDWRSKRIWLQRNGEQQFYP